MQVLRSQISPQLATEDFLALWTPRTERTLWQSGRKGSILAVDIRPAAEYATGFLPYACINLPFDEGSTFVLPLHPCNHTHMDWEGKK